MADTSTTTTHMFCMAVYAASHAINQAYAQFLQPLGLTYPQYASLLLIRERDGLTVGDIARRLHLGSSTLSPLLKRLEVSGFLQRRRDSGDERHVRLHLTAKGHELLEGSNKITDCMIERTSLLPGQLTEMVNLLSTLTRSLG